MGEKVKGNVFQVRDKVLGISINVIGIPKYDKPVHGAWEVSSMGSASFLRLNFPDARALGLNKEDDILFELYKIGPKQRLFFSFSKV